MEKIENFLFAYPLDPDLEELPPIHREFIANWSLRDVEPTSALIMTRTHELEEYS